MDPMAVPEPIPQAAEAAPVREVILQPLPVGRKRVDRTKAREEIVLNMVWLFGALILVLIMLGIAKAIFRRSTMADSDAGRLTSFREMLESGELTQDEYDRIMQKMASKIKGKPPVVPPAVPPATPAQPTLPKAEPTPPEGSTSGDSPAK